MSLREFDFCVGGIEDGIAQALSAEIAATAPNGYVKTIATYGGELDGEQLRRALDDLTPRLPLMLISYAEGNDVQDPRTPAVKGEPRIYRHDCTFTVFCCSGDARGERARRRGAASSYGVYRMIADARKILGGLKFSVVDGDETILLNPEPLKYAGVEYVARLKDLTAYAVHFETYIRFAEPDRTIPGQLVQELIFNVHNTEQFGESNLPGVILE